ncbi:MAG: hypothetical protein BJ554DRAFT_5770, partial [Olpidium bornovanus]
QALHQAYVTAEPAAQVRHQPQLDTSHVQNDYIAPVIQQALHQAYVTTGPAAEARYQPQADASHARNHYIVPVIHQAESLTVVPLTQAFPEGPARLPRIGSRDSDVSTLLLAKAQSAAPQPPSAVLGGSHESGRGASGAPQQYERPTAHRPPDARADPAAWPPPGAFQRGYADEDGDGKSDDGDGKSDDGASTITPMDSISQIGSRDSDDERPYRCPAYGGGPAPGYPAAAAAAAAAAYYETPPDAAHYRDPAAPRPGRAGAWDYQTAAQPPQSYQAAPQPQGYPGPPQPQGYPGAPRPQNSPAAPPPQSYTFPPPPQSYLRPPQSWPDGGPPERYRAPYPPQNDRVLF